MYIKKNMISESNWIKIKSANIDIIVDIEQQWIPNDINERQI